MINLLPTETKRAYKYAVRNQTLIKWVLILLIGLVGVGGIGTYSWVTLNQSIKVNNQQLSAAQSTIRRQNLTGTEKQVQAISNDFSLVVKVLSQEVVFSKLLTQLAATLPNGANLSNLVISNTSAGSGLSITANATNYATASQVEANLSDPSNGIFSHADLVSISCNSTGGSAYPCTVEIQAVFASNNQFLFINQKAAKP